MQPLGIVGPGANDLLAPLAARLDGRVATVERFSETRASRAEAPGPAASFALDANGDWTGDGTDRSFDDLLDDLAPDYDYVLAAGFPEARIPTVALATDETVAGEVVLEADAADDVDLDALAGRLKELEPHVTLESLVERAKASPRADRAGAIATFTGRVRGRDAPDDSYTERLEFEKYAGVAEERMDRICEELTEREGVFEVLMHHRVGVIEDGEDIVFVVVLAGHRREAFRTVEDGIDRLKDEVPIFKKETTTDEEFWVHDQS
ncbi:MAG: molybdopterin synthase [Haloferacaceae archaeon]